MGESVLKSQIPSPALFESIVQTVSDYAIFAVYPHGTVLTWNRGAQRINGYSPDEIIASVCRITRRRYSMFGLRRWR